MADNVRWQALVSRDPAFDNIFVYAVETTRIYCRPICKARLARRTNVDFYDTAAEAEAAGYRACKRCRPQLDCFQPEADNIRAACERLRKLPLDGPVPGLASLAQDAGLTKHHFHRLFKRETGVTPREYALAARTGSSSAAGTSPASAPTTPNTVGQQLEQLSTTVLTDTAESPDRSVLAGTACYTTVETTYGLLLVIFRKGQICKLELCADQEDVLRVNYLYYAREDEMPQLLPEGFDGDATTLRNQIDAVVEALERPSGKTLNLPLTVAEGATSAS